MSSLGLSTLSPAVITLILAASLMQPGDSHAEPDLTPEQLEKENARYRSPVKVYDPSAETVRRIQRELEEEYDKPYHVTAVNKNYVIGEVNEVRAGELMLSYEIFHNWNGHDLYHFETLSYVESDGETLKAEAAYKDEITQTKTTVAVEFDVNGSRLFTHEMKSGTNMIMRVIEVADNKIKFVVIKESLFADR